MRIVLFASSFLPVVGGMEYVVHYLAEALFDHGIDVSVVARRQKDSDNFNHRYRLLRYGLPFQGGHRSRIDHISAYWTLAELFQKYGIDIAHIHGVSSAPQLSLRFFKKKGVPVVMTPHGEDVQRVPEIGYGLRLQKAWDRIIRQHLRTADAVTAISNSIRAELSDVSPERIFDVPNGIHTKLFGRGSDMYLHQSLGLDPNVKIILSVGRNHIKKGYSYGIMAVAELVHKYGIRGWQYVLVGKGVSELRGLVEQLEISDNVSLIELLPPDKLSRCYKSSEIFFSPSIVEGLSLVSIEAMASGLPLVVTDVPGNEDIVRENDCGVIVRAKDISDMSKGLQSLILDPERRHRLAEVAFLNSRRYDWSEIARQYIRVYENVLR